ncbi:hypothetical protein SAMN04488118_11839 [Epibacterium ulvae]|uniref:YCII-related domain-containing protein n=1 Tax=Epibacterium ulvae TaxID=1156985 RepID=A0A1G5RI05_9RHOB|nr:YciI family protein [Epibacterium ulvae]SCZ73735.1 hypothetical protein SAMN04488118_11839 [Epibacterium ulvae]
MDQPTSRYWTVNFQDSPDMLAIRADRSRREAHIAYVRAHPELDIGGEMAMSPMQDFVGAIWYVHADSEDAVEQLVVKDPFYVRSLRQYEIKAADLQCSVRGMIA